MGDEHRKLIRYLSALLLVVAGAGLWVVYLASGDDHTERGASPEAPTVTASAPAACPESGLAIRQGETEAAMGLRVQQIEMVNCGTQPYTVNGYPSLRLLDDERKPLVVTVSQGSSAISTVESFEIPPESVTLQPGQMAVAGLVWRNLVTDPSVRATEGHYLDIAPSTTGPHQVVKLDAPIDLGNTGKLGVSPWRPYP